MVGGQVFWLGYDEEAANKIATLIVGIWAIKKRHAKPNKPEWTQEDLERIADMKKWTIEVYEGKADCI